mmetsp:Transcript_31084/g.119686  ORF Transcript_31084/g.119686 Transcript_31084/m.119686 type:complete len:189 (+) Transcript_31084:1749-2315(+)
MSKVGPSTSILANGLGIAVTQVIDHVRPTPDGCIGWLFVELLRGFGRGSAGHRSLQNHGAWVSGLLFLELLGGFGWGYLITFGFLNILKCSRIGLPTSHPHERSGGNVVYLVEPENRFPCMDRLWSLELFRGFGLRLFDNFPASASLEMSGIDPTNLPCSRTMTSQTIVDGSIWSLFLSCSVVSVGGN